MLREEFPARKLQLAIEVISQGSARHDRVVKRPGYQRRVPDYWVVDVDAGLVEWWFGATRPFTVDLADFVRRARGDAVASALGVKHGAA